MKPIPWPVLALVSAMALCGCKHYEFRLVQPAQYAQRIGKEGIAVPYPPLEYRIARYHDQLAMRITNPTDESASLSANRSYVVDPNGQSHPIRGQVIAPHSFTGMTLPPTPLQYQVSGYYPYAGFYSPWAYPYYPYSPFYSPFYDFYGPPTYSYQVITPFDWEWKTGEVRLHLGYEQAGKVFDHDFVFQRLRVK